MRRRSATYSSSVMSPRVFRSAKRVRRSSGVPDDDAAGRCGICGIIAAAQAALMSLDKATSSKRLTPLLSRVRLEYARPSANVASFELGICWLLHESGKTGPVGFLRFAQPPLLFTRSMKCEHQTASNDQQKEKPHVIPSCACVRKRSAAHRTLELERTIKLEGPPQPHFCSPCNWGVSAILMRDTPDACRDAGCSGHGFAFKDLY